VIKWVKWRTDYRAIFDTPQGKRILQRWFKSYHMNVPVTVQGDPISSAFRDGQRSVVCEIVRTMNLSDEEIRKIQEDEL